MKYFTNLLSKIVKSILSEPLILLVLYIGFVVGVERVMPDSDKLVAHLSSLYNRYGYEILFLGAIFESLIVINLFVPGMVALAFGGVFARSGQVDLTAAIFAAWGGAMTGYIIDYFLGFFGFGKIMNKMGEQKLLEQIRHQVENSDVRTFSFGFFHPNVGSLVALAAGTLRENFTNFVILSGIATLAWFSFWAILVYALGEIVLTVLTKYFLVISIMLISAWFLLIVYGRSKRKSVKKEEEDVK